MQGRVVGSKVCATTHLECFQSSLCANHVKEHVETVDDPLLPPHQLKPSAISAERARMQARIYAHPPTPARPLSATTTNGSHRGFFPKSSSGSQGPFVFVVNKKSPTDL